MTTIFFDLETTGIGRQHTIIQFAAIAVDAKFRQLDELEVKIKFDPKKADPDALRVNGYTPEAWKNALSVEDAQAEIMSFLREHADRELISKRGRPYRVATLAGHNSSFDADHLFRFFEPDFVPADRRVLCTMQLAMWYFFVDPERTPPRNFQLATLCEYFDIKVDDRAHDALGDVKRTVKLAQELTESI